MVHGEGTAGAKALGQEHTSCYPGSNEETCGWMSWGSAGGGEAEGGGEPFSCCSLRQRAQWKVLSTEVTRSRTFRELMRAA